MSTSVQLSDDQIVDSYVAKTNQQLGLAAFTIGLGSIGKGAIFPWLGAIFLCFYWYTRFARNKERIARLRESGFTRLKPSNLLRETAIAIFGFGFLAGVAVGLIG